MSTENEKNENISSEEEAEQLEEATQSDAQEMTESEPEETADDEDAVDDEDIAAVAAPKQKKSSAAIWIIVVAAVLLLAAAVTAGILLWKNAHSAGEEVTTVYGDKAYLKDEEGFGTTDATALADYAVLTAAPDDEAMRTAVARDAEGEYCMTNAELQIYFWMEYYQFMSSYGSYASYFGLDTASPLAGQESLAENRTWEQYFLEAAMSNFSDFRALQREADAVGYVLPEELEEQIVDVTDPEGTFAADALEAGYATADEYVQVNFGAGTDAKAYQNYLRTYYTAMSYYSDVLYTDAENAATDDLAEAYFDENAETYAEGGVTKVNNIAVRHILIAPEGETDEDGNYSDEAWAAAETEAQRIYDLWLEDATVDNFAELATEYSTDEGSAEAGGLYEDVAPGDMTDEFNDWCFDPLRKEGDHAIVKTSFGYHIMYFVGQTETRAWFDTAKSDMIDAAVSEQMEVIAANYKVEINYSNIRIYDLVTQAAQQATE